MRILIAEGETEFARTLQAILERQNYSTGTVTNGPDALDYTATEETESITISDESVLFTAENGSLVSSKVDAIAVGDMLVLSQDIDTNELTQVVVYAASSEDGTGDASDANGTDTSVNGTDATDANSADTGDTSDSTNAAE